MLEIFYSLFGTQKYLLISLLSIQEKTQAFKDE